MEAGKDRGKTETKNIIPKQGTPGTFDQNPADYPAGRKFTLLLPQFPPPYNDLVIGRREKGRPID
jgi:hypothetical protein